jgi:hypothetical protein
LPLSMEKLGLETFEFGGVVTISQLMPTCVSCEVSDDRVLISV